jgi:hypothetical protein
LQWARSTGHLAQPDGIGPSPLGTFDSEPKTGEIPTPLPAWSLASDSGQSAMSGRGGRCWGASPEPTEPIETDWVERGSPMWPTDGEEDDGGESDIGGVNEKWPEWDFRSVSSRGQRGSTQYSGLGRRRMESGYQR